ncbi:THUMP domain-containing class I SAM-dependent RNA methyltransferase [Croceivirga thetidis]|uniref:Class I SAM-dependent RNA methyltransferase n=1 Tax=Croceivirga thetidis TaxID=2721623 RepID=A0ABX1GXF8_9FLAO|nr:THUMP domain-containing protein [Croceivirga thetidis]NKI33540.1 class I SAM-dependent RNA methyltransferase [Croceivirga thetidis]
MQRNLKLIAKTLYGFEELLAKELRNLGASNVNQGVRSVSFEGDIGFIYKANLCLRTAIKILRPIANFKVFNENDLFNGVYKIDWPKIFDAEMTFAFNATVNSKVFDNSLFVALKAKDALVDRFRKERYQRPNVDTKNAQIRINVHLQDNECTISLDSSGNSLHLRGYKMATNIAPINEVLAAGLLLMSGWDGRTNFVDPMCGSGTFLIEAAMIACNIPANINREAFCFKNWQDFDHGLFTKIVDASLNRTREFHHKIIGYDKAPSAVRKAQENVESANLSEYISIERKDFFRTEKPLKGPLQMVFNPPYGERLNIDIPDFYGKLGTTLKHGYPGTQAWFITSNLEALKYVGLRTSRKIKVYNAKLESRFVKYELYEGSKKASKQKSAPKS